MKTTITINGLPVEFTDEVPTMVGDYYAVDSCLNIETATINDVAILRVTERYGVYALGQLRNFHYLWSTSPLIPSDRLTKAHELLTKITAGRFYQSSCRGGEMERLMNQAIEILGGKQ